MRILGAFSNRSQIVASVAMALPEIVSLPMEGGPELGTSSSTSSDGDNERRRLEDNNSTSDDYMSGLDEDSECQSLRSRQDSVDHLSMIAMGRRVSGEMGGVKVNIVSSDTAITTPASVTSPSTHSRRGLTEMGQKRQISQDDRPQQGQLRKACDLCTKV